MNRTLLIVITIVTLFTGFLIGFSVPPFIHAGVFSEERKEKGVESKIDKDMKQYYKDLYKSGDE